MSNYLVSTCELVFIPDVDETEEKRTCQLLPNILLNKGPEAALILRGFQPRWEPVSCQRILVMWVRLNIIAKMSFLSKKFTELVSFYILWKPWAGEQRGVWRGVKCTAFRVAPGYRSVTVLWVTWGDGLHFCGLQSSLSVKARVESGIEGLLEKICLRSNVIMLNLQRRKHTVYCRAFLNDLVTSNNLLSRDMLEVSCFLDIQYFLFLQYFFSCWRKHLVF